MHGQMRAEIGGVRDVAVLLDRVADGVGKLARVDEDGGAAFAWHDRVGERQGRMADVGAADVEGPGDRVRIGDQQRVDAESGQRGRDPGKLVGGRLARDARFMRADRTERGGRALAPDRVDGVGIDRHQCRAGARAGLGELVGCRRCVQPRVKSEAVVGAEMAG